MVVISHPWQSGLQRVELRVSRSGYYSAPKTYADSVRLKAAFADSGRHLRQPQVMHHIAVAGHHDRSSPVAQPDAGQPATLGVET